MTKRRTTLVRMIGVILLVLGIIWTLQGSDVLGGSSMSGERSWLIAGVVSLIVGIALMAWTLTTGRTTARSSSTGSSGSTGEV
jgi:uncharacterized membrane protein YdcZ (DUF606 family)